MANTVSEGKISTSALARQLEIPVQQLFAALKDYGWIRKVDDGWVLTGKGEFEGGEYVHSKRYGRYIVWPPELHEHSLIKGLEQARLLSAAALGKPWQLHGREVNRLLAELGLIKRGFNGWELTARGERYGGVAMDHDSQGFMLVMWPQALRDQPEIRRQLQAARQIDSSDANPSDDLFSDTPQYTALDGHVHDCPGRLKICQWLYLAGIVHATQRPLPGQEEYVADFFLPGLQLYIDYLDDPLDAQSLSGQLAREDIYRRQELKEIAVHAEDLPELDELLTRQLRRLGAEVP